MKPLVTREPEANAEPFGESPSESTGLEIASAGGLFEMIELLCIFDTDAVADIGKPSELAGGSDPGGCGPVRVPGKEGSEPKGPSELPWTFEMCGFFVSNRSPETLGTPELLGVFGSGEAPGPSLELTGECEPTKVETLV